MHTSPVPTPTAHDQWVPHPQGRLFSRRWQPADLPAPGLPIVLLHDSLGCVALWRDFPAALCQATGREVIAYDRLGFGQSDARQALPGLDFVAEEARDFLPQLCAAWGLSRFAIMGHSVGGGMAIECAAQHPDRCEALITLSAQVFAQAHTLAGIRIAREQFRDPAQLERLAKYHGSKARWVLNAWTENWLHPGFAPWSLLPVLPRVRCPMLALHGENDEYGTPLHAQCIGQHSGGPARVDILPGVGHVPHREQPRTVLDKVAAFLRSADQPS
ncbi:MAG: alpha/beta hydrolase [Pseudomonadota bacterium]|nr:alpha/beta hydrolase [Pseudomonadota bacterium]